MKYKIKYYPDGKVFVVEDYKGIDINIGKQLPEAEDGIDLTEKEVQEIKSNRDPDKMRKKIREIKEKKDEVL